MLSPMGLFSPDPLIGAGVRLTSTTNQQTTTFTAGYTPGTTKALVRIFCRQAAVGTTTLTVTIGAVTATVQKAQFAAATSVPIVWIGTALGLTPGVAVDVVIAGNVATAIGKLVMQVNDLLDWDGSSVGNSGSALDATASSKTTIAASFTASGGRLSSGVAGYLDATVGITLSAGWTDEGTATIGSGVNTSASARFGNKSTIQTSATETLTGTGSPATTGTAGAALLALK